MSNTKPQYNTFSNQQSRAIRIKLLLIKEKGGACSSCGYNKNLSSLCFHHLGDKEFQLDARHLGNNSIEKIREEADKCVILCHNCHAEQHYPQLDLNVIKEQLKETI